MEAKVTINGKELTQGQVMTLRVACNSFSSDLAENSLGDDDHGKTMTKLYKERLKELLIMLCS